MYRQENLAIISFVFIVLISFISISTRGQLTQVQVDSLNLPDTDGLRLCELIREKNKTIKILGLTYVNEAGIINN